MRINLELATLAWLEDHLSQFGGLARHVQRTVPEAQRRFLGQALGVGAHEVSVRDHYIVVPFNGELSVNDFRRFAALEGIEYHGFYAFEGCDLAQGNDCDPAELNLNFKRV